MIVTRVNAGWYMAQALRRADGKVGTFFGRDYHAAIRRAERWQA